MITRPGIKQKINQSFFITAHWVCNVLRSAVIDENGRAVILPHIPAMVIMVGGSLVRCYRAIAGVQQDQD